MQQLTLKHWHDQLSKAVIRVSTAAAECIHQVAIRDGAVGDRIAKAGEHTITHMKHATNDIVALRDTTEGHAIIDHLESLESSLSSAQFSVDHHLNRDMVGISEQTRNAAAELQTAIGCLVSDVAQIMALPEVQEARLSHRANVAKHDARAIIAKLQPDSEPA